MNRLPSFHRYSSVYITLLGILAIAISLPFLFSVFKSGYGYQFDTDELHHVNLVYLYANGNIPYRDVYTSFYTPLFEWTLLPVFALFGFSFKTIIFSRFVMILFFIVRMGALYIFIKTLWNKRTALFFIPILLFDPFAVLSSFQIRTDNFMLMLYSIGLAGIAIGMTKQKKRALITGSVFLGLSILSLPKIIPAVALVTFACLVLLLCKKKFTDVRSILFYMALPTILFLLYGMITGGLYEMIQQMVVEAQAAYMVFRAPLPFGAVFYPNNIWIYGTMGKPLTWIYIWILPLIGAGGLFAYIQSFLTQEKYSPGEWLKLTLGFTLIVQFGSLFLLPVVFLQHYLLINWLYAVFAAALIDTILTQLSRKPVLFILMSTAIFAVYCIFVNVSFTYNITRSTIHGQETIDAYEKRFTQIAPSESVFPNFLFRPPIYPVPFGYYIGNVPEIILNRLPDIPKLLEDKKVKKLLFDEYTFGLMPERIQTYITEHYSRVSGDPELMIRKN